MGIVTTSAYGPGSLLDVTDADPFSYISQGVVLYQTQNLNRAVTMSANEGDLTVAGTIVSQGIGVAVEGATSSFVQVTATGHILGQGRAFNVYVNGEFTLFNAGIIEGDTAINTVSSIDARMTIINSGIIRSNLRLGGAIDTGDGNDEIVNTGEIVGDVYMRDGFDNFTNTGTFVGDLDLGDGSDTFRNIGGDFTGAVEGGLGSDTYHIDRYMVLIEEGNEDDGDHVHASFDYTLAARFERLTLVGPARNGSGNDGDNRIFGNGRDNILYGEAGDDSLDGLGGTDTLFGGAGMDDLNGGTGDNRLFGGAGDDFLTTVDGVDVLSGGTGFDVVLFGNFTGNEENMVVNLATQTVSGGFGEGDTISGIEGALTGTGEDVIGGSAVANWLLGHAGDDAITGLGGDDRLNGMAGADQLDGGAGNDTVEYQFSPAGVNVNLATGAVSGGDAAGDVLVSIENLTGSTFNDVLIGDGIANVIEGGGGNDTVNGAGGSDTASYATASAGVTVKLIAGAQNTVGAGSDTLIGIEHLLGSAFNDVLRGNGGANILTGGEGADRSTGNGGADIFRFLVVEDSTSLARDQIIDFSKAQGDKIGLVGIDANIAAAGNQAFTFVGAAAFSGQAGELRVIYQGDVAIVQADHDGDKAVDFVLRVDGTTAAVPLAATDFVL